MRQFAVIAFIEKIYASKESGIILSQRIIASISLEEKKFTSNSD
ncbi:hypothetical protein BpOF4_16735 [Alkalihalophilus pseudofirmus OF4]|uniref:Uncharacterized protein n=1 Tax=Alkalihalophilus pseudofirmus (strain ATCC BAA-2126 / JCM 17055 / OF4) TaxID=398511 RepID=D3FQM0_ALKPO|nr:hypothetical protein BpOF4_16735 [Alkalihalophilus pseudofirmus OF4]